jgi:hypothetical protein
MVALYRVGRQAEALAAFSDARRFLRAELGLEPGTGRVRSSGRSCVRIRRSRRPPRRCAQLEGRPRRGRGGRVRPCWQPQAAILP